MKDNFFMRKLNYLGYETIGSVPNDKLREVYPFMDSINFEEESDNIKYIPTISYKNMIKKTKAFYGKYFTLHDVYCSTGKELNEASLMATKNAKNAEQVADILKTYIKKASPFDINIELSNGFLAEGEISKGVPIIGNINPSVDHRFVPFISILLNENFNYFSIATYAHEIAHSQQESIIGYTKNFMNKEIISMFIEKLALLEIDPTGNCLGKFSRLRIAYEKQFIKKLMNSGVPTDYSDTIASSYCHINGMFLAQKMFDDYMSKSDDEKKYYINKIQEVFDGVLTVDDMLTQLNITQDNSITTDVIKRNI